MLALTVETRQYLNRSRFGFRERSQTQGAKDVDEAEVNLYYVDRISVISVRPDSEKPS
ncbi:hypothetical protein J2S69_004852 [Glycomyces lechevalierae]|uniref:Transposase n=1 Tax=Glycomyces lechevalierae TaxID=256034 RepID=A0ABU2AYQ1_9ACTN|nr:hypothetical protein [Glycomyces lechevalierae]